MLFLSVCSSRLTILLWTQTQKTNIYTCTCTIQMKWNSDFWLTSFDTVACLYQDTFQNRRSGTVVLFHLSRATGIEKSWERQRGMTNTKDLRTNHSGIKTLKGQVRDTLLSHRGEICSEDSESENSGMRPNFNTWTSVKPLDYITRTIGLHENKTKTRHSRLPQSFSSRAGVVISVTTISRVWLNASASHSRFSFHPHHFFTLGF